MGKDEKMRKRIEEVATPIWSDNSKKIGKDLENLINTYTKNKKPIKKIILEVEKPTILEYVEDKNIL